MTRPAHAPVRSGAASRFVDVWSVVGVGARPVHARSRVWPADWAQLKMDAARAISPHLARGAVAAGVLVGVVVPAMTAEPALAASVAVQPGQTLTSIAAQYETSVAALAAANGITDPNEIYVGETLQLPGGGASPSASGPSSVVVGAGETLTSIAAQYETSVAALAAANGITDPNEIYVGETLQLATQSSGTQSDSGLPAELLANPDRLSAEPYFEQSAAAYGVPLSLLEAMCWWESGWQSSVVSVTGAIGICQIEPITASFVDNVLYPGSGLDLYTTSGNIAIGAAYLAYLLQATGGSESLALACYYQGLASVEQGGMLPSTYTYVDGILAYNTIFAAAG